MRHSNTRDSVLEQLKKCKVFHFTDHGLSDLREPSQSCLAVHDWEQNRLTVGYLRDLRLHEEAPFLSYLSACSTSSTTKDKLIDEGIHLVNACQRSLTQLISSLECTFPRSP